MIEFNGRGKWYFLGGAVALVALCAVMVGIASVCQGYQAWNSQLGREGRVGSTRGYVSYCLSFAWLKPPRPAPVAVPVITAAAPAVQAVNPPAEPAIARRVPIRKATYTKVRPVETKPADPAEPADETAVTEVAAGTPTAEPDQEQEQDQEPEVRKSRFRRIWGKIFHLSH